MAERERFLFNVSTNILYMVASSAVMLWYVPYLIRHLGVEAYSMLPLATSIVGYAVILADSLNLSIYRFLALDLNQGDQAGANKTFNTGLMSTLVLCLILGIPFAVFSYAFPELFNVPHGFEFEARILFGCVAAATILTLLSSTFGVSTLILHRFDLRNLIQGAGLITRVAVVVVAFELFVPRPWYIGLAFVSAATVALATAVAVWRRLTPHIHVNLRLADQSKLSSMCALGGWAAVVRIGILLFSSTGLIVVNLAFGAALSGRYGALLLLAELVRVLAQTGASVLSPAIMARFAKNDFASLSALVRRAVKLMGLAISLPVGLLAGFSPQLLSIWLGEDFAPFGPLLVALVAPLVVNSAILPLAYVLDSYNKMRLQASTTVALGLVNVGAAYFVSFHTDWGLVGVALTTSLLLTLNNLLLAAYGTKVLDLPWFTFYPPLVRGVLYSAVVACVSYGLMVAWPPLGWVTLGIEAAIVSGLFLLFAARWGLEREEKQFIISVFPPWLRARMPGQN